VFIKFVLRIPLRLNEQQLMVGDDAVHGEEAYALFFEGERSHISLHATGFDSGHIIDTHNLGNHHESGQESPPTPGASKKS
jgi:Amt family ammonium transporter